jgi:hypothetical protein
LDVREVIDRLPATARQALPHDVLSRGGTGSRSEPIGRVFAQHAKRPMQPVLPSFTRGESRPAESPHSGDDRETAA